MSHRRKDIEINPKKYYIIDTVRLTVKGRPKMLRKAFDNSFQVKMCLDQFLDSHIRFDYLKGSEAIKLGLKIMMYGPNVKKYLEKYLYKNYMITSQDKKSYRTKFRRHNRTKKGIYYKQKA